MKKDLMGSTKAQDMADFIPGAKNRNPDSTDDGTPNARQFGQMSVITAIPGHGKSGVLADCLVRAYSSFK